MHAMVAAARLGGREAISPRSNLYSIAHIEKEGGCQFIDNTHMPTMYGVLLEVEALRVETNPTLRKLRDRGLPGTPKGPGSWLLCYCFRWRFAASVEWGLQISGTRYAGGGSLSSSELERALRCLSAADP